MLATAVFCIAALASIGCARSTGPYTPSAQSFNREAAVHDAALVYAVNTFGFSVTAFHQSDDGNVPPTVSLAGNQTKIYEPSGLALSPTSAVAVTNAQSDITFYAPGANGNVAPVATLGCPTGGQGVPGQLAFDTSGTLYVKYFMDKAPSDEIGIYEPDQQSGCVKNERVIFGNKTKIGFYGGIAVSAGMVYSAAGNTVLGFHTSDSGNVRPSVLIKGFHTGLRTADGLAIDAGGALYVANGRDVLIFAPSANGNVRPVATIRGSRTGIPKIAPGAQSIALGDDGTIFVGIQNASSNSILVFAPGSNGNVAPTRVIAGSNTGIDWIAEMAVSGG